MDSIESEEYDQTNRYYASSGILFLTGLVGLVYGGVVGSVYGGIVLALMFWAFACIFLLVPRTKRYKRGLAQTRIEWEKLEQEKATVTEALCEHLRRMGIDAVVESRELELLEPLEGEWSAIGQSYILGSIKIADRHIDRVEVIQFRFDKGGDTPDYVTLFRCDYLVQANVMGLENKLKAFSYPVRKSFFSLKVVDFRWEGTDLAQVLNSDADLKTLQYSPDKVALRDKEYHPWAHPLHDIEIKPHKTSQFVRIRQMEGHKSPMSTFPTTETFEAYDRIGLHIRSISCSQ